FGRVEASNVVVNSAQEVTYNAMLKVGTLAETVEVGAQAEAITLNKTNPTIGLTATARQAVDLPLSAGRDVNNLMLLSPNVFVAPGQSPYSANGQRARNNNFMIDGSDNNDVNIAVSTTPVVPEAVAEYQVQTNAYSAEFGRNSGAQINVITRSGTNKLSGDAFEYYRGSALNALDNIEKSNGLIRPARINRNQFGFSLGAPVIKDRSFVFGLMQGDLIRNGALTGLAGTLSRIPTPAGFAALANVPLRAGQSSASRKAMLDAIGFLPEIHALNPVFRNVQNTTVNGVAIETAQTNIPLSRPSDSWYFMVRGDHRFSANDNFTARYTYNDALTQNLVSNLQFGSKFSGDQSTLDQNLALSETHVFSPVLLNEFRASYIRRNLQFPEHDPRTPTTAIGGFFSIGGASTFPQGRVQNSYQFSDTLSWQSGRHALKFGLDIRRVQLFNIADFNTKGTFSFNNLQDYLNNVAVTFTQSLRTASFDARYTQQFYFAHDDFRITPNLTLNFGFRYEYSGMPFGLFGATDAESLAALVPGPAPADKNNFGPAIGFAYSPRAKEGWLGRMLGDGKTSFRGGYRINYDQVFLNVLSVNGQNYPRVVTGVTDNAIDVYPALQRVTGAPVFSPTLQYVNSPVTFRSPYGQIYSLTAQRELLGDYLLEFGYSGSRSLNGINQLQANPAILTPEQAARVRQTGSTTSIPTVQERRVFPQFGSRVLIGAEAQASYNAGFVSLNKRLSHGFQFGAAYTFSKNISNNDESLGIPGLAPTSPQAPQDFLNYRAEKSVSVFDAPHRFVAHYIYEIPWFKSGWAEAPVIKQVFTGWQFSGVTSYQSGQPFTIVTGVDSNGNGAGGDRPNYNPSGAFTLDPLTGDMRSFRTSKVDGRYLVPLGANGSPLAFSLGNGNLGKNTLRAAGYWNSNLSLSKRVRILEGHTLTLRVDMLNAFNQDTYGIPDNNLNSLSFGLNTNNWGNRTVTLGAKYTF
ncbi:MAG: hypothetical protein ACREAM_18460, partial [Blastocatellia bacterium]